MSKTKKTKTTVAKTVKSNELPTNASPVELKAQPHQAQPNKPAATVDAQQVMKRLKDQIFRAVDVAIEKGLHNTSIKIDENFREGDVALLVPSLEESNYKVDFCDKKGADYRIMSISW
jgi:hypothetical protein